MNEDLMLEHIKRIEAERDALRDECERRRADIAWLFAAMRGMPPLADGEAAHDWTNGAGYESRYIADYGSQDAQGLVNERKFRQPRCANCGQTYTY